MNKYDDAILTNLRIFLSKTLFARAKKKKAMLRIFLLKTFVMVA